MSNRRAERVGSFIQQEVALMIQRELTDPRITGFPSITRVEVSDDLSQADIFMTIMGTEGAQLLALNAIRHSAGLMRTKLTKIMSMRQVPFLKFHLDEQLKKELAVLDLIKKVEDEKVEMEARAAKEQARIEAEEAEHARLAAEREARLSEAERERLAAERAREAEDAEDDDTAK